MEDPLKLVPAAALCGGTAMYLLAHVAFRLRNIRRVSYERLGVALLMLALIPVAERVPAVATLGIVLTILIVLIAYERVRFAELRDRLRHQLSDGPAVAPE